MIRVVLLNVIIFVSLYAPSPTWRLFHKLLSLFLFFFSPVLMDGYLTLSIYAKIVRIRDEKKEYVFVV